MKRKKTRPISFLLHFIRHHISVAGWSSNVYGISNFFLLSESSIISSYPRPPSLFTHIHHFPPFAMDWSSLANGARNAEPRYARTNEVSKNNKARKKVLGIWARQKNDHNKWEKNVVLYTREVRVKKSYLNSSMSCLLFTNCVVCSFCDCNFIFVHFCQCKRSISNDFYHWMWQITCRLSKWSLRQHEFLRASRILAPMLAK